MTTNRWPGVLAVSASTERTMKLGIAAVPATASAPLCRKNLRFIFISSRTVIYGQ
jgi:hypothetical protein